MLRANAYTVPRPKTTRTPIFFEGAILRPIIIGIGSKNKMISVTILATAVAIYRGGRSRHLDASGNALHDIRIGLHVKSKRPVMTRV